MEDSVKKIAQEIFDILEPKSPEKHYHNAFKIGLKHYDVPFESERTVPIVYKDKLVADIRMDLVVDGSLVVELKSLPELSDEHKNQLARYMRVSGITNGILINFGGPTLEMVRATGNPVVWC